MAQIRPLTAIRYAQAAGLDLSALIAPPYDVLDERGKAALQAKHPANIVSVDLPHLPPKTVGPDAVYQQADATFQSWLQSGILHRDLSPGLYPYRQTYQHDGKSFTRQGFFGLVRLSPFGAGQVVPHEKTYASPIEDRLKLMRATGLQLSPIFGLYDDPDAAVAGRLCQGLSVLEGVGTLEGVRNELWRVDEKKTGQGSEKKTGQGSKKETDRGSITSVLASSYSRWMLHDRPAICLIARCTPLTGKAMGAALGGKAMTRRGRGNGTRRLPLRPDRPLAVQPYAQRTPLRGPS